ncbi:MAG: hypothetical protein KME03_12995 [Aphanocapsa lilacina HA4352-LM1]|jgi:hypothetical protein|nr:hypothetical protein [Aphanocapsa lilacina HA4352-LM1]
MTSKADFSAGEWRLLRETPLSIGAAVMVADTASGFFGMLQEGVALAMGAIACAADFPDNNIIQSILSEEKQLDTKPRLDSPEARTQFKAETIDLCRQSVALLAEKATPQEAEEYRRWLVAIARKVAEAAKEGGFLGIGGQRVSEAEAAYLTQIDTALGVGTQAG